MFIGNDLIDLRCAFRREHFPGRGARIRADPQWLKRHLTQSELNGFGRLDEDPFTQFWKIFACKEAAYKALAQSGLRVPDGAYTWLQTDPGRGRVEHLPSGRVADIVRLDADLDKVHCIAQLCAEGENTVGQLLWGLDPLPPENHPSDFVRERLLGSVQKIFATSSARFAITSQGQIPKLLDRGIELNWSVSLSHSGRFVAYSLFLS